MDYGTEYKHPVSLPVTEESLRTVLSTALSALADNRHGLMRAIAKEHRGGMKVFGTNGAEWGDSINHTSDHATRWETSILWYLRPELVDIYRQPRDLGRRAVEAIAADLAREGQKLLLQTEWFEIIRKAGKT